MMAGVIVQWNSVTTLVGLCTFVVHTRLLGQSLSASQGFTSLSLFSILRFPLLVLPDVINFYLQVWRTRAFESRVVTGLSSTRSVQRFSCVFFAVIYVSDG